MINGYDIAYGVALAASAPVWLLIPKARRKVISALRHRNGEVPMRDGAGPAAWIHAVSLGEINATAALVARLCAARSDLHLIISTTTTTGWDRARQLYGQNPTVTLVRFPLDFTRSIVRLLDRLRPSVMVLMELEVWPNLIRQCARRRIPVAVINGRLTTKSYAGYRRFRWLLRPMFRRLSLVAAQDATYARRFIELGVPESRVQITGTMKFDTAQVADRLEGADQLAAEVGLEPGGQPIWVCGSTGPGEERLILAAYRRLLRETPRLRLVLVPRKPERFDEVADIIEVARFKVVRRSQGPVDPSLAIIPPVILGDTMGELRKFYAMADLVFVGRTLVDLGPSQHGSDMIEPAALGRPVLVGPFTGNFAEAVARLRDAAAILEVSSGEQLTRAVATLLADRNSAREIGRRAQEVVRQQQGATSRNLSQLLGLLPATKAS